MEIFSGGTEERLENPKVSNSRLVLPDVHHKNQACEPSSLLQWAFCSLTGWVKVYLCAL